MKLFSINVDNLITIELSRKIFSNEQKYNFENMYDNDTFVKKKQLVH